MAARMSCGTPPSREKRNEKLAAMKTIAEKRRGNANSEYQYSRCLSAEKPAPSALAMKRGSSQNEIVSGEAKLSWICDGVSSVGKSCASKCCGNPSPPLTQALVKCQWPLSKSAEAASMRPAN